jgi:phenylalanyl-tRNA synthetase beta subunit
LAYNVRLNSGEQTLGDDDITRARAALLETAASLGAVLR